MLGAGHASDDDPLATRLPLVERFDPPHPASPASVARHVTTVTDSCFIDTIKSSLPSGVPTKNRFRGFSSRICRMH
jgi:hypothetical protein